MADYFVTGKKGNGKTLATVGRIRDALLAGKRVCTNLDLNLDKLLPANARKVDCIRLPDKPTVDDLEAIGLGTESRDESKNGLIVLDELGTWLNARTWADKSRQAVIDWLLHSRKKGWDVYFIVQSINVIDKQVRETNGDYLVTCRRLDRLRVPFIGGLFKTLTGYQLKMPQIHVAAVRYGLEREALIADRWTYRGRDLYEAYDTRQVFTDKYSDGLYCYLTPWHTKGRYLAPSASLALWLSLVWRVPMYAILQLSLRRGWIRETPPPAPKEKHKLAQLLAGLSPDEAVRHWNRLNALGAFD